MRIFRAKVNFKVLAPESNPNDHKTRIVPTVTVLAGTAFIAENTVELPDPIAGGITNKKEVYEEIVPKNMLIKLDSFVKVKSL